MTSNNEKKLLTKSDINKVFWRSFTVNASFNYERQMSQGAQYALSPILQKLYPDKKELGEALQRHAEFFNTTPMLCPFIFGITAAMEEENATQEDFDPNTINSVKAGLMGPLAGIGDSVFWGTLRPLAGGIACSLALTGNLFAPFLSIVLMIYSYYYSKKMNIPVTGKFNLKNCIKAFFKAIWGMLAVMFVVVGVIAGVFTTTESAAAAVVWSLCVGLFIYKGFSFKDIPHIFANVVETLGKVLILLGVSGAFTYLLTYLRIPTMIATGLFSITSNKIVILVLLNILMLCLGCLIEMACLILMLTPVILPIWMQLGLSPIHLGIVMVLNLGIGLLTPPVGSTLFIGSAISGIKIETLAKKMVPFYITMFIALIILTYFPQTFMWLPNLLY